MLRSIVCEDPDNCSAGMPDGCPECYGQVPVRHSLLGHVLTRGQLDLVKVYHPWFVSEAGTARYTCGRGHTWTCTWAKEEV